MRHLFEQLQKKLNLEGRTNEAIGEEFCRIFELSWVKNVIDPKTYRQGIFVETSNVHAHAMIMKTHNMRKIPFPAVVRFFNRFE